MPDPTSAIVPANTSPAHPVPVLPHVSGITGPMLDALTSALGIRRDFLPSEDQIEHAWSQLPRQLRNIPPQHRSEVLLRMCVAVAAGLFDSAINYAWNAAIIELRQKVRAFGLSSVHQFIGKAFDEEQLLDMKDAELLALCLKLNLVSEDGFFLLDQCRAVRNNMSAAHPAMGMLNEDEFIGFLSRVGRHAFSEEHDRRGLNLAEFLVTVKSAKFDADQLVYWSEQISRTFDAQREMLFGTLHGIFCDPSSGQEARVNALDICAAQSANMTQKALSVLVDQHEKYRGKAQEDRLSASRSFFTRIGRFDYLSDTERHGIIVGAAQQLMSAHNAMNNFYNEPPHAEKLMTLTKHANVPASARATFVEVVITCGVGNGYGTSHGALGFYHDMVRSFSPAEIEIMLGLPKGSSLVAQRIKGDSSCKRNFQSLVKLLDQASIPTVSRADYDKALL